MVSMFIYWWILCEIRELEPNIETRDADINLNHLYIIPAVIFTFLYFYHLIDLPKYYSILKFILQNVWYLNGFCVSLIVILILNKYRSFIKTVYTIYKAFVLVANSSLFTDIGCWKDLQRSNLVRELDRI